MQTEYHSTIYCVGGGISLKAVDFRRLNRSRVIAINKAFLDLPHAEVVYFTDKRFYDWFCHKNLLKHSGRLVSVSAQMNDPRVEQWRLSGRTGIDLTPGRLCGGNNAGYAAINLAMHLGARRIILLGYDMTAPDADDESSEYMEGDTHYHGRYPVRLRKNVFTKMLPYFRTLVKPARDLGVGIINAVGEPESRIDCFPKVPLEEALP